MIKLRIQLIFIFGKTVGRETEAFQNELNYNDDIVIGDFDDSWKTLFLKTWTGHKFLNSDYFKDCNGVNWVIFQDDDAFIDYTKVSCNISGVLRAQESLVNF